jgi:hypothetical protein
MSKNFSAPSSKAKPASVTTASACASAMRVAAMVLVPCAMFANGPPCTNAGTPSTVCTRFGLTASLSSAAIAPTTPVSEANTGEPSVRKPTTMRASRCLRSGMPEERQRIAITSLAAVMSKPVSRGTPSLRPPSPITTSRSARSFMSSTRFQSTRRESSPIGLP